MYKSHIFYLGLVLLLLFNCREDETIVDSPILVATEAPILLEGYTAPNVPVNASVYGQILDEDQEPLQGVKIEAENHETTTDNFGLFYLSDLPFNAEGTLVKAIHNGYILGSRTVYPQEGSATRVKIALIPKELTDSFQSSAGGTIQHESGASIQFEANGIVFAGGGAYEGKVDVFVNFLDPTKIESISEMPGDLSGIRPTDSFSETGLKSFGMLSVELYSDDNRKLQLAEGKPAVISLPLPENLKADAPDIIPLWYFNESVAKWVEEGEAVLENEMYTGAVTHFSFWNCVLPVEHTVLCLIFEDQSGRPISGLEVFVKTNFSGVTSGFTNEGGFVAGFVPANEPITICTGAIVNGAAWSAEIDPISSKTTLEYQIDFSEISTINPKFKVIPGHITCGGQDVENVLLRVESSKDISFYEIKGQPFEVFHYLDEGEAIEKVQVTDLNTQNSTQEIIINDDAQIIWINDYELCHPDNEEFFMIKGIIGSQWDVKGDISMWEADFVSPGVLQIQAIINGGNSFDNLVTMNFHDIQGAGDYSGTMEYEGRTFSRANIAIGFGTSTFATGSPQIMRLTKVDKNGFIEGEFSGQLLSTSSNSTESLRGYFGKFRVRYVAADFDGSYLESIINGQRQVEIGLSGREDYNGFFVNSNSLDPSINMIINGTTTGDYSGSHTFSHFFNLLNFSVGGSKLSSFNVTKFDEPGGFVEGDFEGESKNPIYYEDDTLYPVYGTFSILSEE